jgi:hypothetical protein
MQYEVSFRIFKISICVLSVFSIVSVVGCGAANEAIDATKSMPGYMQNMTNITKAMKTDTLEKMRLQQLGLCIDKMEDSKNTVYLSPAPFDMFVGAKCAADVITAEELIEFAFLGFTAIDKQSPDKSAKVKDPVTGNLVWPPDLIASVDHGKLAKLAEIELIAAYAPENVINDIIEKQIIERGPYEPSAYPFLMARVIALQSYLIQESILNNPLVNVNQLELAVTRTEYLKHIADLPFTAKLKISTYNMLNRADNVNVSFDPNIIKDLKEKLRRIATTELATDSANAASLAPVVARIDAL